MPLDRDILDAYCNQGDDVSKDWLIPILREMAARIEALEDALQRMKEDPDA
jgi:vancomycin permeability regulator SanA